MASKPSPDYLDKIKKWIDGGLQIEHMSMTPAQKFRGMMCLQAYHLWMQNKQVKIRQVMVNIAKKQYIMLCRSAEIGNEDAIEMCRSLGIEGKNIPMRSPAEISNDVYTFNHVMAMYDEADDFIEKSKVLDGSDWLISEGMKRGDPRSVKSGIDTKMTLFHNFDGKENPAEQMPNTMINITGDVGVIKSDRANYTDEEKIKMAKRFGLSMDSIKEMKEREDGTYIEYPGEEKEKEKDVFEEGQ